jgi:hypothetical protein
MVALGDGALAQALVKALYDAKHAEEYHLRMVALLRTMEADRVAALAAEVSGGPTQKPQKMWGSSENARTRRLRNRAEGRASVQAAKDSAAEAKARAEQEAAAGVATGVEEALADVRQEGEKEHFAQAQAAEEAANDVQDSGDMKEAGDMDDEEQEVKETDDEEKEQAGPATASALDGGGAAAAPPPAPETLAIEHEQEKPDHEEGVEEEGELISLVQQPEAVEEAVVVERLFGSKAVGESAQGGVRVHHSFFFPPPKRERKLSGEVQQEEAQRPKSPEKEAVGQAEQHGSGGEGGDEMEDVGQDGMDGLWERHTEKLVQAAALQTQQSNQLLAMMKQWVEEGRNPVTGLPPPARR